MTAAQDNRAEIDGAKAAASYLNDYKNGLNGHVIQVKSCETLATPAGATDCGDEMVAAKVAVVLVNVSAQTNVIFKAIQPSGIPLVFNQSVDPDTLSTPGTFVLTNAIAEVLSGPASFAAKKGVKRVGILAIDFPAVTGTMNQLAPDAFKAQGVAVDVIAIAAGTPDMTPQVVAEMGNNAGMFQLIGDPTFCATAMKGLKTAGFKGPIVLNPSCIDDNFATASGPGGLKGTTNLTAIDLSASTSDGAVFHAVLAKYASGTKVGGFSGGGYQVMTTVVKMLQGLSGDVTSASVLTQLKAATATPFVLGDGVLVQCDGKQMVGAPNICSKTVVAQELDTDGSVLSSAIVGG